MQGGNRFPLAFQVRQATVSLSTDVSGVPALTIGPNNQVYFAAAMKGTYFQSPFPPPAPVPTVITTAVPDGSRYLYNIVVGNYASDGTPLNVTTDIASSAYYSFFNSANVPDAGNLTGLTAYQLQGTTDDSSPSIAVGPDLEMYIAYVTQSQIPQRTNMSNVPTFCGCQNQGSSDVVVARLTNVSRTAAGSGGGGPGNQGNVAGIVTVADWRLQDASVNSCSDETAPQLAIDRTNSFLYLVHQTNYQILCYPVVGTDPNIILSCLDLRTGAVVWREAQGGVNGSGQTRAPAIAVDTLGGVYVAAEITGPMTGGRDLSGATYGVDVVKMLQVLGSPGVFVSESRAWVLSQFLDLSPGVGTHNGQPTIAADPVTGAVLVAFVTTGQLPGQSRSVSSGYGDVVVVTFQGSGSSCGVPSGPTGFRVQQGGVFNPPSRPYLTASSPYATADPYGNFYLSVNVVEAAAPHINNVLLFKVLKDGTTTWSYNDGTMTADAYAIAGDEPSTDAPNSIFPADTAQYYPTPAAYSQTPIAAGANLVSIATVTNNAQDASPPESGFPGSKGLAVGFFREALYYLQQDAYTYMANTKSICACGKMDCGC